MSCRRFASAITDHACGAALDREAASHLGTCAACQRRLRRLEAARAILDDAERHLARALTITASDSFGAAVAARVRAEPPSAHPTRWWLAAAAGLLIAGGVSVEYSRERAIVPPASVAVQQPPAVLAPHDPVVAPNVPRVASAAAPDAPASPSSRAGRKTRSGALRQRPPEPIVLVAPDQGRALARFRELLGTGALDAATLPPAAPAAEELIIAPLTIAEITVPDVEMVAGPVRSTSQEFVRE